MSVELKIGQVWKLMERFWEIVDIGPLAITIRETPSGKIINVSPNTIAYDLHVFSARYLGEVRFPKIGQVFKRREDGELVCISGFDRGRILFSYVGDVRASFWYPCLFKAMEKNEYLGEMPVVGATYIRAPNHVRQIVNVTRERVRVRNVKTDHEYTLPLIAVLRSYKPYLEESKPVEALVLKVGQVWKFGPGLWEVMEAGQQYSTIKVHPNGEVCKSSTDSIICNLKLFKAVLLGEMPKVGDVFARHGWHTKVLGFSGDYALVPEFKHPNDPHRNVIKIESLLTEFKKVEGVNEPEANSIFFDGKTNSVFMYEKKNGFNAFRSLKTNILIRSLDTLALNNLKFIGLMPKEGDLFKLNGQVLGVSRIEKDQVFCGFDNSRLYGRETKIPLYVLLTTYVPCNPPSAETLKKPVTLEEARENFARKVNLSNFIDSLDKATEIFCNRPLFNLESVRNLSLTGRKRSEPEMQEFPSNLMSQRVGRTFRPNPDVLVLDYSANPWVMFSPENCKDPVPVVAMTSKLNVGVLQRDEVAMCALLTFCGKHFHDRTLTLMPQVGDVYKHKGSGRHVRVNKIGKKKLTITCTNCEPEKITNAELAKHYKWVG